MLLGNVHIKLTFVYMVPILTINHLGALQLLLSYVLASLSPTILAAIRPSALTDQEVSSSTLSTTMANPLASCVSSLRSTNALLSSSISILDNGVNDFPRLGKVLQTTRVSISPLARHEHRSVLI